MVFKVDAKTIFLNSLYDEQLGFFSAHEYSENLEELLENELNKNQLSLFKKWKSEEMEKLNSVGNEHNILSNKLDRIETMLEKITARLEAIEERTLQQETVQIASNLEPLVERMAAIENLMEKVMTRLDTTNEAINTRNQNIVDSVLTLRTENETFQTNNVSRLEAIENGLKQIEQNDAQISDDISSLVVNNKRIEASQTTIVKRLNDIEEKIEEVKIQQNNNYELLKTVKEERKKSAVTPTPIVREGLKMPLAHRVEMLDSYTTHGVTVRKGEILTILRIYNESYYVIGADGKAGWVPKHLAKEI